MIQLNIISGKQAGAQSVARRFPFRIGRAAGNELQLEDDGVWDQHLTLEFQKQEGFKLTTSTNALTNVNGEPVQNVILRNGDIITVGLVKIQFWLAAARQGSLLAREFFVWALIAAVTATQLALVYWLLR
jgi:pSer/pThr/pTyr-binding forkhead associated (FHA) protein